ncbi:hypothetical protein LS72_002330 [Helicobacter apodemus]|uniref:Uncharacterized protein n=1 Tax=Helicobacter apodemus TaxID=135569 RepID=A0A4U8UHW1_9HELI|nr:hypothetical protein [Helicobacter apodemus]TLE16699.1 hypothetical protein LS72_002330 [Helicobacter apodemus]
MKKVDEHIRAFIKYALEVRSRVEINLNCVLVEGMKEEMELFMQKWEDCLPFINYVNFSNEIFLDERGFHKEKIPENRYVCHWPFF